MASQCASRPINTPLSFRQMAHTRNRQRSEDERDRLALTYSYNIAQIRQILGRTANDQGISIQQLLAAVQTTPSAGHDYSVSDLIGFDIRNLDFEFERSHLSPVSSQHTPSDHQQFFSSPNQPSIHVEEVGSSISDIGAAISTFTSAPESTPQYELANENTWPVSHTPSPTGPAYAAQFHDSHSHYTSDAVTFNNTNPSMWHQHTTTTPDILNQTTVPQYQHSPLDQQLTPGYSTANDTNSSPRSSFAASATENTIVPGAQTRKRKRKATQCQKICQLRGSRRTSKRYEDEEQQRQTNETRRRGACIRCRMQRTRCVENPDDPDGPCLTCLSVTEPILYKGPCRRDKIKNARLLDHEERPRLTWTDRWSTMEFKDIIDWDSPETRVISVTQDIGGLMIKLRVRRFIPRVGDALARRWVVDGKEYVYWCTPYAIENMQQAGEEYEAFVKNNLRTFVHQHITETDPLIRNTYVKAWRYAESTKREEEKRLLWNVFRLWMGSRMETRSDRICGDETLDMAPWFGSNCYNEGKVLLPPVLTAQAEIIVTKVILRPAAEAVLQDLQDMVAANKAHSWFAIYLAMFILMHSCSLLIAADYQKAKKQGLSHRPYRRALIEELHMGAKNLLTHFHYISKGRSPFALDGPPSRSWPKDQFNAEQLRFLEQTSQQIKDKARLFAHVRRTGDYEHEAYLFSQLYDSDWDPDRVAP